MDHHGGDAHFLAGADDAKRDFTAIGDQDFFKHALAENQKCLAEFDGRTVSTQISLTVPLLGAGIGSSSSSLRQ